ncbi:MAG: methyltransferase domain-containing protein [Alphaproteobacteria bacterium]|nr:methyltransferase domain-containing protein [Alphaproteobacteria bacterium]
MPLTAEKKSKREENLLFFKQLVKNPKALGALVPSSEALGKFISKQINLTGDPYFVEIGAGTGSLTMALLRAGVRPDRLFVVEIDPSLSDFLKKKLPSDIHVITGDACHLSCLLPEHVIGHVDTVISGIPMMNLTIFEQMNLIQSSFQIMKPEGSLLQFTYGPLSPLPAKKLGLQKKRVGHVLLNFPPATIWRYTKIKG